MVTEVTWGQTVPVPQPDDQDFGIPFCTLEGMTPDSIPDKVHLLKGDGETSADGRDYTHRNLIDEGEMDDLQAAFNTRVRELGETHDLIAIGEGGPKTSHHIAIFTAPKGLLTH